MTLKSHACIGGRHPLAVISDGDGLAPCADDLNLYLLSSSVDRVLDELLDEIGRCRYDLTGCYLIRNGLGE